MKGKGASLGVGRGRAVAMRAKVVCLYEPTFPSGPAHDILCGLTPMLLM